MSIESFLRAHRAGCLSCMSVRVTRTVEGFLLTWTHSHQTHVRLPLFRGKYAGNGEHMVSREETLGASGFAPEWR